MEIKREILMQGVELQPLKDRITDEAQSRNLAQAGNNEYGPVFINAQYDLRIERDPGEWGHYRLMLLHKLQPKRGILGVFKKK